MKAQVMILTVLLELVDLEGAVTWRLTEKDLEDIQGVIDRLGETWPEEIKWSEFLRDRIQSREVATKTLE